MSGADFLPCARVEGLITTETDSDVLIYDAEANELHTLNAAAAAVWRAADGSKSVAEIAVETALNAIAVEQALQQLTISNLLVNGVEGLQSAGRRRFLKKAAIVSIPAIVSVSVPLAQAAASYCGKPCLGQNDSQTCKSPCNNCKMASQTDDTWICCHPSDGTGHYCS